MEATSWRLWAWISVLVITMAIMSGWVLPATAAINEQIPFYGTLKDSSGNELSGTYDMVFRFYDAPSGGTLLDTSTHTAANGNAVSVSDGEFSVLLGSGAGNTLDGLDFDSANLYIGLSVEGDSEMTPRERLGAAPYAFNSDTLDGYHAAELLRYNATGSITATSADTLFTITQQGGGDIFNIYDAATEVFSVIDGGNVGIGTSSPARTLAIDGDMQLTGAFYDATNSAGTSGFVLQSTGAGAQWVATSSLGISGGGGSSLFTDGGLTTYLTATSDRLAIGTTTAPAGVKLYVSGGRIQNAIESPQEVAGIELGNHRYDITVVGGLAYIVGSVTDQATEDVLQIVDVSDPYHPTLIGGATASGTGERVVVAGDYAYVVSDLSNGYEFEVFDVSNPSDPVKIGGADADVGSPEGAFGIALKGGYAYVTASGNSPNDNLLVFDISDPTNPQKVGGHDAGNEVYWNIAITGRYGYVPSLTSGDELEVFDLSDPTNPTKVGGVELGVGLTDVIIKGTRLYAAASFNASEELYVFDISNPIAPVQLSAYELGESALKLDLAGDYLSVGTNNILAPDILLFDVSSSTDLRLVAELPTDSSLAYKMVFAGNFGYAISSNSGDDLEVFALGGIKSPTAQIGSLLSDSIDTATARITRLLTVDGSLQVGSDAFVTGALTVGGGSTSSPALSVNGEITLASTSPATTTNALYNLGGTLYFNGAEVGSGASLWTASGTDLYYNSGNVGIGTTSPNRMLTVAGDLYLTGALYDNTNSAGVNGYVLQTTGTGFEWVATSTLGGGGASSSPFTTVADVSYLTSTTSSLVLGTTTAPAGSRLHVVGGVTLAPGEGEQVGTFSSGVPTAGCGYKTEPAGGTLYALSTCNDHFITYDITDPRTPTLIGSVPLASSSRDFVRSGSYVYAIADTQQDIIVIDVRDPAAPSVVNSVNLGAGLTPYSIELSGNYLYIAGDGSPGTAFYVYSISNPENPTLVTAPAGNESARAIRVAGNYAYLAVNAPSNALSVWNIRDRDNPIFVASTSVQSTPSFTDFAVSGNLLYLPGSASDSLSIVNVADPNTPSETAFLQDPVRLNGAVSPVVSGEYLYLALESGQDLVSLDISDQSAPRIQATTTLSDVPYSLSVQGKHAFLTGSTDDVMVVRLDGISAANSELGSLLADRIDTEDLTVNQSLTVQGNLNVAHDTLISGNLAALGGVTFGTSSLATTSNTLYTVGDTLFFDGTQLATFTPFWIANGDDIFYNSGNVGIGTSTPSSRLTVESTGNQLQLAYDSNSYVNFGIDSGGDLTITPSGNGTDVMIDSRLIVTGEIMAGGPTSGTTTNLISGYNWDWPLAFNVANATGTYQEVMRLTPDLDVGIGTTTPSHLLTVAGDMQLTGALFDSTNSSGTPGYILTSTGNGVQWSVSGGGNNWSTLGSNVYYNGGNVGVGTTSPNTLLTVSAGEDNALLALADSTNGRQANVYSGTSTPEGRVSAPIGSLFIDTLTGDLYQKTGDAGGPTSWNVFAAATTTGTTSTIHKAKMRQTTAQSMTFNTFIKMNYDTVDFDTSGMADTANDIITIPEDGVYLVMAMTSINNFDDGDIALVDIQQNGTPILRGTESGSISNFNLNADVQGVFSLSAGDEIDVEVNNFEGSTQNTNVSSVNQSYLAVIQLDKVGSSPFTDAGTTTYLTSLTDRFAIGTTSSSYTTSIWGDLFVGTSSTPTLLVETGSGQVGIGTTTFAASSTLTVDGTITASNLFGGAVNLTTDANGNIIRDPSDERLKTNITDIDNALELVTKLRGVRYNWKDTARFGSSTEIGFIAQEVDLILPEVVRKGGDYWSLNTRNILAVVVEAVKELWQLVSGNEAYITELENRVETLEAAVGMSTSTSEAGSGSSGGSGTTASSTETDSTASTTDDMASSTEPTSTSSTNGTTYDAASSTPGEGSASSTPASENGPTAGTTTATTSPGSDTGEPTPLEDEVTTQPASTSEDTVIEEDTDTPSEEAVDEPSSAPDPVIDTDKDTATTTAS